MRGKIVLITGASSGIGRAAALRFAALGAVPVLAARSVDKLQELAADIETRYGVKAGVQTLDVRSDEQAHAAVQQVLGEYGRIDILVNNAGWGVFKTTLDISMEQVEDMMDVNYFGFVRMTKAVLPAMLKQGSGQILNVASLAAFFATATHGAYAATKFAMQGFSDALRYELHGTGVTLSNINPGPVETAFWDNADRTRIPNFTRFLTSEEVADTILRAAREQKPLYLLPKASHLLLKFRFLFPRLYDKILTRMASKK